MHFELECGINEREKTFVLFKYASYIDSYIKNKSDFLQMVNEEFGFLF